MANISHGMNVEEIRSLGNRLQQNYSGTITSFVTEIDKLVNNTSSTWLGTDANNFRSWWPAKRSALKAIADDLHGFGQSALNNVSDQERASGS